MTYHHPLVDHGPHYQEMHDAALDFIEQFAGEGFVASILPVHRQDVFVENIIALRQRDDQVELQVAADVLETAPRDVIIDFFCEQSIFGVTFDEGSEASKTAKIKNAMHPVTSKMPLAWAYAKIGLKEALLVHPLIIPSIAALGVPLHDVEIAAAMYVCREGVQVAYEFLERHFDPLVLTRLKKETDVNKWPVLPLLERSMKMSGETPENLHALRIDLAMQSRVLMEKTMHATLPSLRLAMHTMPEKTVVQFCDAALRGFSKEQPPIDLSHHLIGEQRERAHAIGAKIAEDMGIAPNFVHKGLAHVFDGVEAAHDYMAEKAHKTIRKIPVTTAMGRRIDAFFGVDNTLVSAATPVSSATETVQPPPPPPSSSNRPRP